jgi:hypothetical protein
VPAPAPTELLNQDIGRTASAIEGLAARFDENTKYQRDFNLDVTKQLGQINTKMESLNLDITKQLGEINTKFGSVTTTLRIAGTIVTLVAGAALTLGVTSYQQLWSAGKREGILETKVDMLIKSRFDDYIKNPNRSSGDRSPAPPDKEKPTRPG